MVSSVFFDISWKDAFLMWNKTDYGDTDTIRLPVNKVWKPDIVIMNSMDSQKGLPDQQETVKVRYDGSVTWWPGGKLKTKCHVNVAKYPFDSQTCDIVLQPWGTDRVTQTLHVKSALINPLMFFSENPK